eukprot:scaffold43759_cov61-Cyclotella_meneghiniana.AAC.2
MPHRYGAAEYTYVERDDDDVLGSRIKATRFFTGSDDGIITHCNQLARPPTRSPQDDDANSVAETKDGQLSTDKGQAKNDADYENVDSDEDDDPVSNSQTYFGDALEGPGKRRRTKTPSPTNKNVFTNSDWAVAVNPACFVTIHDLKTHAMHFPSYDKLTDFHFVAYNSAMDLQNRTLMAVFVKDEATAEAYAHWIEHRSKLLFNVNMQTEVMAPAFKSVMTKCESNQHEETMAVNALTEYAKSECPVDRHAEFKAHIMYCNHPSALVTKLITEWKVTERIKEINTKRASPKSALDFDVQMAESTDNEVVEETPPNCTHLQLGHPPPDGTTSHGSPRQQCYFRGGGRWD